MESIGEILRKKREEKDCSIEQVARDTNIANRFLMALESEDFTVFPGEPYLVGFLRNYSEYLGINPEEMVTLYKNMIIQEQPIPMEELLDTKKRIPGKLILILSLLIVVLCVGSYFIYRSLVSTKETVEETTDEETTSEIKGTVYELKDEILERRFLVGDVINIPVDGRVFHIKILSAGDEVALQTPNGKMLFKIGEERKLDLNNDSNADIKLYLRDIDRGQSAVVLHFDRSVQSALSLSNREAEEISENAEKDILSPALGSTNTPSRKGKILIITESETAKAFSLKVVFRGYCLFRYLADGKIRDERYFHKGETFRIDVDRKVCLWISNAGSFKVRINEHDVDMGKPGKVATKLIQWVKDEQTGRYQLQVIPVY